MPIKYISVYKFIYIETIFMKYNYAKSHTQHVCDL